MITDSQKWHYLAVKSLSKLLREIMTKNNGDHYFVNFLHSFRTANKLKSLEGACKDHDHCHIKMPEKKNF